MEKRGSFNFGEILIWIGVALIIGWAILKSVGFIHSPIWVEMIPYYGVGVAAIGASYKIGRIMKGIEITNRKVNKLLEIESRFLDVENTHKLCLSGKLKGSPYKIK